MLQAPSYPQEALRQKAVEETRATSAKHKKLLESLVAKAKDTLHIPIVAVSLVDKENEVCEVCQGPVAESGPRAVSFCGHALLCDGIFVVEDTTKDQRFADNPYVINSPFIRFYAGVRLFNLNKREPVGVFCIKDTEPRKLSVKEIGLIIEYAEEIQTILNS